MEISSGSSSRTLVLALTLVDTVRLAMAQGTAQHAHREFGQDGVNGVRWGHGPISLNPIQNYRACAYARLRAWSCSCRPSLPQMSRKSTPSTASGARRWRLVGGGETLHARTFVVAGRSQEPASMAQAVSGGLLSEKGHVPEVGRTTRGAAKKGCKL